MEETRNKITIYFNDGQSKVFEGNYYLFREDFKKEGCVHFRDGSGKHYRIYNASVTVEEM